MTMYYKAVRPDGTSFHDGSVRWEVGKVTEHPAPVVGSGDAAEYLSVSVAPTDCTGMGWPCRLFEVEPVGEVWTPHPDTLPHKRAAGAWRVVRELPAHVALGPQGEWVAALVARAGSLTPTEERALDAAWGAAWTAAWATTRDAALAAARAAAWYAAGTAAGDAAWTAARYAAWTAAWTAARDAARYAAWDAARYAAWALAVRDLIGQHGFTQAHYDTLTRPWATTIGPAHPDDADIREDV